jgi:hypothetical protein
MTDIIDRSPMIQEEFLNKVADSIWLLMEQRVHKAVEERIAALGNQLDDDEVDNRIQSWMANYFDITDYGFDLDDYSYQIDGMIDAQVQYLAEDGDLKEWLSNGDTSDDETLRLKVMDVIGDITVGFDIK